MRPVPRKVFEPIADIHHIRLDEQAHGHINMLALWLEHDTAKHYGCNHGGDNEADPHSAWPRGDGDQLEPAVRKKGCS